MIKWNNEISIKTSISIVIILVLLMDISSQQQSNTKTNQQQLQKLDYSNQQQQFKHEQIFKKQQQNQLNDWINMEIQHNQQFSEIQSYENIMFLLKDEQVNQFRITGPWRSGKLVKVSVFRITDYGYITLPDNPTQDNFVSVSFSNGNDATKDKVYIQKVLQLDQNAKIIIIKNISPTPLIIQLSIQKPLYQSLPQNSLSDSHFQQIHQKILSILQSTKNTQINRQHIYKWQWGFLQIHYRHQYDMLAFTGVELLIIIVTTFVQMYCIKNLLYDELII